MKIFVKSNKEPLCVKVTVLVAQPMKVYIRLCDKEFPLSVYTDRFATIENEETFLSEIDTLNKMNKSLNDKNNVIFLKINYLKNT